MTDGHFVGWYNDYDIWPDFWTYYTYEENVDQLLEMKWYYFPYYPYWIDFHIGHC